MVKIILFFLILLSIKRVILMMKNIIYIVEKGSNLEPPDENN